MKMNFRRRSFWGRAIIVADLPSMKSFSIDSMIFETGCSSFFLQSGLDLLIVHVVNPERLAAFALTQLAFHEVIRVAIFKVEDVHSRVFLCLAECSFILLFAGIIFTLRPHEIGILAKNELRHVMLVLRHLENED